MRALLLGLAALTLAACDSGSSPATTASILYAVSGPAAVTFTDASGGSASATTSGAWEREVAVGAGTTVALAAQSTSGAPVTASLYVDGQLVKSSQGANVRVSTSSSSSSSSQGEIEVEGGIEALSATSITVLGITFSIDGSTAVLDDNNDPTTLASLAVGTRVEVKGRSTGSGSFRATRIKPDDDGYDGDGVEIEIEGTIQAIDASSVTVGGRVFTTTASTRYLDDDNNPIPRSAFAVGTRVEAEGHEQADGTIRAEKIKQDDD